MEPKMTPAVRAYIRCITSAGGRARAEKHDHRQLSAWAKMGGRPRALTTEKLQELDGLRQKGLTQRQIASELGVSLSTVVRSLARNR